MKRSVHHCSGLTCLKTPAALASLYDSHASKRLSESDSRSALWMMRLFCHFSTALCWYSDEVGRKIEWRLNPVAATDKSDMIPIPTGRESSFTLSTLPSMIPSSRTSKTCAKINNLPRLGLMGSAARISPISVRSPLSMQTLPSTFSPKAPSCWSNNATSKTFGK